MNTPRRARGTSEPRGKGVALPDRPVYMFGLQVHGLAGLPASHDPPQVGRSHAVAIHVVDPAEIAARWQLSEPRRILERRLPDGRLVVAVDEDPGVAFRIEAPAFGIHMVSADGSNAWVSSPEQPDWYSQRLLFSQTLPIAATLQGVGLFHASAVRVRGRAVGITAPSGTGKTSTAAHLVAQGAEFVTDDVLALDLEDEGVIAYAGPEFFSIEAHEVGAVAASRRERLGVLLGESVKQHFRPTVSQTSLPLGLLYLLERDAEAEAVRVDDFDGSIITTLLASAFIPHLSPDQRLVKHLELCGQMASAGRSTASGSRCAARQPRWPSF
jgi:hypothetical protein